MFLLYWFFLKKTDSVLAESPETRKKMLFSLINLFLCSQCFSGTEKTVLKPHQIRPPWNLKSSKTWLVPAQIRNVLMKVFLWTNLRRYVSLQKKFILKKLSPKVKSSSPRVKDYFWKQFFLHEKQNHCKFSSPHVENSFNKTANFCIIKNRMSSCWE